MMERFTANSQNLALTVIRRAESSSKLSSENVAIFAALARTAA